VPPRASDHSGFQLEYVKIEFPTQIAATPSEGDPVHQIEAASHTLRSILDGSHPDLDGKPIGRRVAQVIFGGKLTKFTGKLPGILEEAMIAESYGIGLFVIGGFGGAAEALARFLAKKRTVASSNARQSSIQ
jgi:hypothetical protein